MARRDANSETLTLEQAARVAGVSIETMREWVLRTRDPLPHVRVGRTGYAVGLLTLLRFLNPDFPAEPLAVYAAVKRAVSQADGQLAITLRMEESQTGAREAIGKALEQAVAALKDDHHTPEPQVSAHRTGKQ